MMYRQRYSVINVLQQRKIFYRKWEWFLVPVRLMCVWRESVWDGPSVAFLLGRLNITTRQLL